MSDETEVVKSGARTDDLAEAQRGVSQALADGGRSMASGWLDPRVAWAVYSQSGVLRQVIGRMATLMASKPWSYVRSDVVFDWSGVQSDLEDLMLSQRLRTAALWAMIFGGAGLVYDVDDVFTSWREPLDLKRVRGINQVLVKSAVELVPEFGKNWANTTYFTSQWEPDPARRVIHRSRVSVVVAHDVPETLGAWGGGVISAITRWPPSWIEGVYNSLNNWQRAESDTNAILHALSILVLKLEGFRDAATDPDSENAGEIRAELDAIAANLGNGGLLTIDQKDNLAEVSRNIAGIKAIIDSKQQAFVADTGTPNELVMMLSAGSLGTNSGPFDAYNQLADATRVDMFTAPINTATQLVLAVRDHALVGTPGLDPGELQTPKKWTLEFESLAGQSEEEKAKTRKLNAESRKLDESLLPEDVLLTDPALDGYAGITEYRELRRLEKEAAEALATKVSSELANMPASALENTREIATRLRVSPSTVSALRASGVIEGVLIGSRWRYHWPSVWQAVEGKALSGSAGAVGEAAPEQDPEVEGAPVTGDRRVDASSLGLSLAENFGPVFGRSEAMREIFAGLERVSPSPIPVLIQGERGTGKEGVARGIHDASGRDGPMVAINCGAVPRDVHGAAVELLGEGDRPGPFEESDGGSIFLDEVGELSEEAQAVLLRALSGDVRRVGGESSASPDVRVVSATWRDVANGWQFRRDLYDRLAGFVVEVPPLRDRERDVIDLAVKFYDEFAKGQGWTGVPASGRFTDQSQAAMLIYAWPGNVRELKNAVHRGAWFAGQGISVGLEHMQLDTRVGPR